MTRPVKSIVIATAALAPLAMGLPTTAFAFDFFGDGPIPLQVGGFVGVAPEYEGSDEYRVIGFPIIAPAGDAGLLPKGLVEFNGISDIRFRVLKLNGFELGPVAGYRFDREEDDGDLLAGLGDIDGGLILGAFAAYGFGPVKAFASYQQQVTGDDTGAVVDFGAQARFQPTPRLLLKTTVGATWASEDFNQTYFGITDAQAANSAANLVADDVDAGIKDVYFGVNSDVLLTDLWTLKLSAKYSRLVGDAGDSQVVEAEDQFFGGVGLTYRFTLDR